MQFHNCFDPIMPMQQVDWKSIHFGKCSVNFCQEDRQTFMNFWCEKKRKTCHTSQHHRHTSRHVKATIVAGPSLPEGQGGDDAPADFGRSVNPILIQQADYASHITSYSLPDFQTFLRPLLQQIPNQTEHKVERILTAKPDPAYLCESFVRIIIKHFVKDSHLIRCILYCKLLKKWVK